MTSATRPRESVREYPRPPRVEDSHRHVKVVYCGTIVAESARSKRVLETTHPPGYYIPLEDVRQNVLMPSTRTTLCEWKGRASYYTLKVGETESEDAAWYYLEPTPGYAEIANYVSFYPGKVDACYVDGELVLAEPGRFYGGWVTSEITDVSGMYEERIMREDDRKKRPEPDEETPAETAEREQDKQQEEGTENPS